MAKSKADYALTQGIDLPEDAFVTTRVYLDTNVYQRFHKAISDSGLSVRDAFESIATLIAEGNEVVTKLIEHLAINKLKILVETHKTTVAKVQKSDNDLIYQMIEEAANGKKGVTKDGKKQKPRHRREPTEDTNPKPSKPKRKRIPKYRG